LYILGAGCIRRRYVDYPAAFGGWNMLISIGAYISAAAFLFGIGIVLYTLFLGRRVSEENYWGEGATTLEWTVSSPPAAHTFDIQPTIR
jgi:cytochrome c oxidase subunit 1